MDENEDQIPRRIIKQIKQEEIAKQRGKLKIFLATQ